MQRFKSILPRNPLSRQIPAHKSVDAQFLDILRSKCIRAAGYGALTAMVEVVPGLGRVVGLVFGGLLDVNLLARVQKELIEETFALYEFALPKSLHSTLVATVQRLGAGAGISADLMVRGAIGRSFSRVSGILARRTMPLTAVFSSALINASVTYAIGKRAQAVAKLRVTSIDAVADLVRAFSGIDERRIYAWTTTAIKGSLSSITQTLRRMRRANHRT